MYMKMRKPLIVFTPKSLLRHPRARSKFSEMATGTSFKPIIPEEGDLSNAKKLVLCAGKVYYDLIDEREKAGLDDQIAITRVEQLHPFPHQLLKEELARYGPNTEVCWAQEEHKNAGAWTFVKPRIQNHLGDRKISYVGRSPAASAATGNKKLHKSEYASMIKDFLKL